MPQILKPDIPKKYKHREIEQKWAEHWDQSGIYRWNPALSREQTFIVDTPPPTVSGSLHVGHVFSYTHTDLIVRYQRMCGKNILYPMGWDDNGLPTERRVQNKFNITCNPHLAYDASWKPSEKSKSKTPLEVSRRNFIEACATVTEEDERAFESLWRHLGLSVDWYEQYATINQHCIRISQISFLDLVEKNLVYHSESPTMWDVDFKTALAQADLEDKVIPGAYHDLRFAVEGSDNEKELVISTTRPELLPACIAVVAHPDDERYQALFGKQAVTPLFEAAVPIEASEHADPEKGTGILMVCTFGDAADVEWWKSSSLPIRQVIGADGRFRTVEFGDESFTSRNPARAQQAYGELKGLHVKKAQKRIVELLSEEGSSANGDKRALIGEPKPIEHPVKFYEKGDRPLEFITTRQWFIKILEHKAELLEQGKKIQWHPAHMRTRFDHWVEGLNQDWCISRQRFFGVPFPVWYPVCEDGSTDYEKPIYGKSDSLPIDPLTDAAPGYDEAQRDKPGGFTGDPDVMDTWATSSLTPQLVSHWGVDNERHARVFPMDMRPQSHEIIRTWAFYTIAKAWMHENEIPWKHVVISGWILDPDRKKMSKSKGNVVTPDHLLEEYSSDGVRYWAARARLGVDTAFDDKVFSNGRKLATKLFNASRFVLMQIADFEKHNAFTHGQGIAEELDRAFVSRLRASVGAAVNSFEKFDYASALQATETEFWYFCDNYLELVKSRAYAEENVYARCSAVSALSIALSTFLRSFAPFMPYITEEIWSWYFAGREQRSSIHTSPFPTAEEFLAVSPPKHAESLDRAVEVVEAIRQAKSDAQKTLKWPVEKLVVRGEQADLDALAAVLADMARTGRVVDAGVLLEAAAKPDAGCFEVQVTLADSME